MLARHSGDEGSARGYESGREGGRDLRRGEEILAELARLRVMIGEVRGELTHLYARRQVLLVEAYQQKLNMSEVARTLGVTREAMYRVLRKELTRFER